MQNTDVEIGFVKKARCQKQHVAVSGPQPIILGDIKNCWNNTQKAIDFANQCIEGIEASDAYKNGDADTSCYLPRAYWYFPDV